MSKRPVIGLIYTLRGLQAIGENIQPVLDRFGLDLDTMDPAANIDRALELQVLAALAGHLEDPLAGLKAGDYFGLAGYGPFVMLLMSCANAYEAFQTGIRYQDLTFLTGRIRMEPGEHSSALVLTPLPLPDKVSRFRIDGEMSGTLKLVRDLQAGLGVNLTPEALEFPYPEPPEKAAYEKYFRCPVRFDAGSEARAWIRNDYLQLKFPTADPVAHRLYRDQCDQLLVARLADDAGGVADKVSAHLKLFSGDYPGIASVASALGVAERTLRRQLAEEGTSFRQLLDAVRFDKARDLLQHSALSVEQLARQLGYGEPASFIRAFQRWCGTSPAAYRRKVRQGA